jgi:hypothetical protein
MLSFARWSVFWISLFDQPRCTVEWQSLLLAVTNTRLRLRDSFAYTDDTVLGSRVASRTSPHFL